MTRFVTKFRHWFWGLFRRRNNSYDVEIDPGEVLLDARNIPGFNVDRLEGVFQRSISRWYIVGIRVLIIIVVMIFAGQLIRLQVIQGGHYQKLAEQNRLDIDPIIAERGTLSDRNGKLLAWNEITDTQTFPVRKYISPGFGHLLGAINAPQKDKTGNYWRTEITGESGAEEELNEKLSGVNGANYYEVDAKGNRLELAYKENPLPGSPVHLSIDAGVQQSLYSALKEYVERLGFHGGAGIIMNIKTGEILALTNYPEVDSNVLSMGTDRDTIVSYNKNSHAPYLNRVVAGQFIPGSTVKPYLAIGALNEGLITPSTTILSTGQIEIPNKYDPSKPQIFRDHHVGGNGVTNVYKGIAESVNTFFYAIGGGYGNQDGLGIDRIGVYARKFGLGSSTGSGILGEKSGNIPSPAWKLKTFKTDNVWRLGDTYNSSIGQYGFLVTPIQLARAVSGIANGGTLITPTIIANDPKGSKTTDVAGIDPKWYAVIQEAMRDTVLKGTAQIMNVSFVHVAGKTGTAQVGPQNKFMNSWITGYFPYESPQYSFAVLMDYGPSTNQTGSTFVMRQVLDWMNINTPGYFEIK